MNRYSLNTMMTFSYDNKGFLLLGNKTCDSHGNIKNVSTILFNTYHSPLVLCLSSCVFCWFRDDLGTMQKVEIKPHQMAPEQIAWWIPKDVYLGSGGGGGYGKASELVTRRSYAQLLLGVLKFFFLSNLCHWLNSPLSRVFTSVIAHKYMTFQSKQYACRMFVACTYIP